MALTSAENFVTNFHSLEGANLSERRRNFFKLLHQNASLKDDPPTLDLIFANLVPKSYLEELYKLDALIYFRRSAELLDILKAGDEIFVNIISKHDWLFEQLFGQVDAQQLVDGVFPTVSYQVRMKILQKLSRILRGPRFDEIFDGVNRRYGPFVAFKFVTGCSSDKLKNIFRDRHTPLSTSKLKFLYKNDPELIDAYIQHQVNFHKSVWYEYDNILRYICAQDPAYFNYLKEKYSIEVSLGRRTSRKIFSGLDQDQITAKPLTYSRFLHLSVLTRKLGRSYQTYVSNSLVDESANGVSYGQFERQFLRFFPSRSHYQFFKDTIQLRYGVKIVDHPDLISFDLINSAPSKLEKIQLAKIKIDKGDDKYFKYLDFNEAFPLIKEKVNLTSSIQDRKRYIRSLVENCHVNNNLNALTEVLKYFCFRHRNDQEEIHDVFLSAIQNTFGYHALNEEMWKYVNELLTIRKLRFNREQSHEEQLAYVYILFTQNKPIDELLLAYFEPHAFVFTYVSDRFDDNFVKYYYDFFVRNLSQISNLKKYDEKALNKLKLDILDALDRWNGKHKDHQISFFDYPVLVERFNLALKQQTNSQFIRNFIINKVLKENDRGEYFTYFWHNLGRYWFNEHVGKFLRHEILAVVTNFDNFIKDSLHFSRHWYTIKKLTHLGLDDKCVEFCLANLKSDTYQVKSVVKCLSIVMSPQKYIEMMESLIPSSKKVDLKDSEAVEAYNLRCAFALHARNTRRHNILPLLLKYCVGDYFGSALPSLSSLLYHTPEQQVSVTTAKLAKLAVSVRKHALFMTCELCDVTSVAGMIKNLNETEGVESLRKRLLDTTIKFFVKKHPSQEFFEFVKMNMRFINKKDDDLLDTLIDSGSIPMEFKGQYVEFLWILLEEILGDERPVRLTDLRRNFLSRVCNAKEVVQRLSFDFCAGIIQYNFDNPPFDKDVFLSSVQRMVMGHDKRSALLQLIVSKEEFDFIVDLFNTHYTSIMELEDLEFLNLLSTTVDNIVTIVEEHFNEYVKLVYLKLKIEFVRNQDMERVCRSLVDFIDNFVAKYGSYVLFLLVEALPNAVDYFTTKYILIYHYLETLLNISSSVDVQMFVILMMPVKPSDHEPVQYKMHMDVLDTLSKISHVGIKLYYRKRFVSDNN